ncbi:MAG: hypothetical protein ACJAUV_001877 [Flavobacteriales bacterium]|jgi:hypothetical protein
MYKKISILISFLFLVLMGYSQENYQLAVVKYRGGGDWYANPTSLPSLIDFCNKNLQTNINPKANLVDVGSTDLYNYPFVHLTGHGTVIFNEQEAQNLRNYLLAGGFLHIDDNYGLDGFIRPQMQKVFPELTFELLPNDHPIFHQKYEFKDGLPKIHEHDNKPAQAFGLVKDGRLLCLYTFESDLGDGWEVPSVHNDTPEVRQMALQMGANIIMYAFGTR